MKKQGPEWLKEFYGGLKALEDCSFPKTCNTCGRTYQDSDDFVAKTASLSHSTGLAELSMESAPLFVGLFRNCLCGSTLIGAFQDRRDTSEAGLVARQRFDHLLELLTASGFERDTAREELLKLLRGEENLIIQILPARDNTDAS